MSEVLVRRLGPQDWQVYRTVRLRMLQDAPDAFATRYAEAAVRDEAAWRAALTSCDHHLAEVEGAPAGAAGLAVRDGVADLIGMWVAPEHRGGPVGTLLVEAVCERARALGQPRLLLDVVDGNDRARRFYERLGFVPTGRRQLVPGHDDAWEQQMVRRLR